MTAFISKRYNLIKIPDRNYSARFIQFVGYRNRDWKHKPVL